MNKVVLLGRLVKDPDLKFSQDGKTAVVKFTVATNRPFKKDEADFISCIAFGKAGETITQYLTKGSQIAINGNIRTGSYEAKDGTKKYTTEVVVESFEFVGSNNQSSNENPTQGNTSSFNNTDNGFEEVPDAGDIPF